MAVTVAVPLLGLLTHLTPAQADAPRQPAAAEPTGSRTVDVQLTGLTPEAPEAGNTVTVTGTLTNRSKQTITEAHVALRVGQLLTSRSAIDVADDRSGYTPGLDGNEIADKYDHKVGKLTPKQKENFTLSVPVKDLQLGADGVYQIGVSFDGRTSSVPWQEQVLGIKRTYLPWQPEPTARQSQTTALWPLISSARIGARTVGGGDDDQNSVFENDDLAKEILPGGRLDRMVALGKELDVTWVIDPDLINTVADMADGYRLAGKDGKTVAGSKKNKDAAASWLDTLGKALAGRSVVALPYGDPDLASIAHNGTKVPTTLARLKTATDIGRPTLSILGSDLKLSTDYAWPADGAIDRSIVDVATSAGATQVLTRSDSLSEPDSLLYTPSAARPIGGGTTAIVTDTRLSTAFEGSMDSPQSVTLAVQRFLAQSLALTRQDEQKQRTVVIAPQRTPTAAQAEAMATALRALQGGRWSLFQELDKAAKTKADPQANTRVPPRSAYPGSLRKQELPTAAFTSLHATQKGLDSFQEILQSRDRVVTPFGLAMDRAVATTWRGRAGQAATYRTDVRGYLDSLVRQVRLIPKTDAKLSGHSATIPVTVQNNLLQDAQHLKVRLTSTKPTRLKIGERPWEERAVKIGAGHSQTVKFDTTINANGPVLVTAQLVTDDNRAYGQPVEFSVDATEVTSTVMLVIAGGVLLLVLAGLRMYTQRKRRAREDGTGGGGTPAGPHAPGAGGPAPAGEDTPRDPAAGTPEPPAGNPPEGSPAAPDTGSENIERSGTGERVDR
ncbi:DUF6049 family protein [Streptomyces sp. SPB074]|uniref:DUF6049 family protein n=1 Tax=Streptomyces sp. (strain SPB074) TaxID=465543 RepID=UPI00017F19DA|nr:DUF6049 family protein [Streptomyces sp. SPB074]EDY45862.2 membrane protein [Streptomyces sp. SPB074]